MGIGCDGCVGLELGFDGGGTAVHGILRGVCGPDTVHTKGDSGFCETEIEQRDCSQDTACKISLLLKILLLGTLLSSEGTMMSASS